MLPSGHMTLGYDPIRTLMDEHQVFLSRVETARQLWRQGLRVSGRNAELPRQVLSFAGFLGRDVDELHAAKEEHGLFPQLRGHLEEERGQIQAVLDEHQALRELQDLLERNGEVLLHDIGDGKACASISRALGHVDALLSDHIVKEDFVLFPIAQELLSSRELREVAEACLDIERRYRERYGQNPNLLNTGVPVSAH